MTLCPDSAFVGAIHPSPNFEPRRSPGGADMLLLHYTGLASVATAIDWLARPQSKVSCHYVIDEAGLVTQMVAEDQRAWHAGVARWAGQDDINSCSIGIEIHNPGHDLGYPDFPPAQMRSVLALCRDITRRRHMRPERVLAHSDVAPLRKSDPGEKFDWAWLARKGVGHWVDPVPVAGDPGLGLGAAGTEVTAAQALLVRYGYGLEVTGQFDGPTEHVVRAFQRHFRPALVTGRLDASTLGTLERLLAALAVT